MNTRFRTADDEELMKQVGVLSAITEKTDLQKFMLLYAELGLLLYPHIDSDGRGQYLRLEHENGFDGYVGFFSDIRFTKEGKFINQGFWE